MLWEPGRDKDFEVQPRARGVGKEEQRVMAKVKPRARSHRALEQRDLEVKGMGRGRGARRKRNGEKGFNVMRACIVLMS